MNSEIIHSDGTVLLVGGGECNPGVLKDAISKASHVVAADGGALHLLDLGIVPDAVIGDMDSLPELKRSGLPGNILHRIAEQNSTDFDKCLRNIRAPLIVAHGFTGARLDHQMAVMTGLCLRPDRRCIVVGAHDVVTLLPPDLSLDLAAGTRLSLFPMGPVAGRSTGLRWPIDGLTMEPDGTIGTSNSVTGPVRLTVDAPRMLLMLPEACRGALERALSDAPGTWPARAG